MDICSKMSFEGRLNSNVRRAPSSKRITKDWQGLGRGSWFEISEKQGAGDQIVIGGQVGLKSKSRRLPAKVTNCKSQNFETKLHQH